MNLWENVIKIGGAHITKIQFDFKPRRVVMEAIYLLWHLMVRYWRNKRFTYGLHWFGIGVWLGTKRVIVGGPKEESSLYCIYSSNQGCYMYERVTTRLGVHDRITTGFPITVVLPQNWLPALVSLYCSVGCAYIE